MEAVKKFIRNFDFLKKEREELYRKAFRDALADFEETRVIDIDTKAKELMESEMMKMLCAVDMNHVVKVDKQRKIIFSGEEQLDAASIQSLKAEAELIMSTRLWKMLSETPRELAHKALFIEGENLDTMKKGRSMLYLLRTQQNIIDIFRGV